MLMTSLPSYSSSAVCATTRTDTPSTDPMVCQRCSPPSMRPRSLNASGSANTRAAVSKVMPCLCRLRAAFVRSHLNRSAIADPPSIGGGLLRRSATRNDRGCRRPVPPKILDALRRMGLLALGTDAHRRTPDRRRLVRHLAHRPRRRPDLREARAGEAARGGGLAGAGRAQPLRGALDAACQRRRPGCRAGAARPRRSQPARWRCSSCRPTATRCGRRNCATATPIPASPPQVADSAGAHPRRHRRRSCGRRRLPHRPDLLRHPPGALSGRDRPRASRSRAAAATTWSPPPRPTSARWCTATSARRTSCAARTARCSSTPNAPGGAIRPSISPSASITCC